MKTSTILAATFCLGLAACGGIGSNYNEAFDPQALKESGPVDVSVIGAPNSDAGQAVADALREQGFQAGEVTPVGSYDARARLVVVFGPAAKTMAASGDGDNDRNLCRTLNGPPAAALNAPTAAAGDRTPTLAVLCSQNTFLSLAYGTMPATGDISAVRDQVSNLVSQVVPAQNWDAYDNANRG